MPGRFVTALTYYKINLSPIVFRADSEVNPIAALLIPFDEELIEITLGTIGDI